MLSSVLRGVSRIRPRQKWASSTAMCHVRLLEFWCRHCIMTSLTTFRHSPFEQVSHAITTMKQQTLQWKPFDYGEDERWDETPPTPKREKDIVCYYEWGLSKREGKTSKSPRFRPSREQGPGRQRRAVVCVYRLISMKEFADRLLLRSKWANWLDSLLANVRGTVVWYASKSERVSRCSMCLVVYERCRLRRFQDSPEDLTHFFSQKIATFSHFSLLQQNQKGTFHCDRHVVDCDNHVMVVAHSWIMY